MTPYASRSGKKSGVTAYEIGGNYIVVQFYAAQYKYSYSSCGQTAIERMIGLALASNGLSTFIAQNKPGYDWKR